MVIEPHATNAVVVAVAKGSVVLISALLGRTPVTAAVAAAVVTALSTLF